MRIAWGGEEGEQGAGRATFQNLISGALKIAALFLILRLADRRLQFDFDGSFREKLPQFANEGGLVLGDDVQILDAKGEGFWFFHEAGGTWKLRSTQAPTLDRGVAKSIETEAPSSMLDDMREVYQQAVVDAGAPSGARFVRQEDWNVGHWWYELLIAEDEQGYWSRFFASDLDGR